MDERMIEKKIEWALFQDLERILWRTGKHRFGAEKGVLDNLLHALFQGDGFGRLLSVAGMMEVLDRDQEGNTILPKEYADELTSAAKAVHDWIDGARRLVSLTEVKYAVRDIHNFPDFIFEAVRQTEALRAIKEQSVNVEVFPQLVHIQSNEDLLRRALAEILTNAYKYSPPGSQIDVTGHVHGNFLLVDIYNDIEGDGIPEGMENSIFEPFVRLSHRYDERFHMEEIGFGMGLTLVQEGLAQTGAQIFIGTVQDHAFNRRRIQAEMAFPLAA